MRLRWRLGLVFANILVRPFIRLKVEGRENLLKGSAQILASNHRSHLDPVFASLAVNQEILFVAKEELFRISKFFTWLIKFWNAIPLARNAQVAETLKKCSQFLGKQKTVLVFPEGTRNKRPQLMPFKSGVGFLSITNRAPVIPVAINGIWQVWHGRITRWIDKYEPPQLPKVKKPLIMVRFGEPVYPLGYNNTKEDYQKLSGIVQSRVEAMLHEA